MKVSDSTKINAPRISVFVPSYNHAAFVSYCLRSIFKQKRAPDELLVIDDGSRDDSPKIIEKLLNECPFACELIARPNKGLAATLNEGLSKTKGDYFAYLGSDDLWLPEFLEARLGLLESRPDAVLAHGNAYTIDAANRVLENSADWSTYVDDEAEPFLKRALAPVSSTVCHRRAALEKYGWNERARLEDFELYLYLIREGKFAFDPRPLSAWRMHGENTSANLEMMLEECLAAHGRAAKSAGISQKDLNEALTATSLEYALLFARRRMRSRALSLLFQNWLRAPTLKMPVKILGHCLLPQFLKQRRDERKRRSAGNRFESVRFDVN